MWHYGVWCAAVRAGSDDIFLRSTSGGLRFSLALAGEALQTLVAGADAALGDGVDAAPDGALAREIARREGELPVLRLPFPAPELGAARPEGDAATPQPGQSTPEAGMDEIGRAHV